MKNRFEAAGDVEFMFREKAVIRAVMDSVSYCLFALELWF